MPDLGWAVPTVVALAVAALVVIAVVAAVRVSRRSRRAQAAADEAVVEAATALLRLDDAVDDLDVAFEASDAVDAADLPADLRRGRTTAHRSRDRGFADVSTLEAGTGVAARRRREARRLRQLLEAQHELVVSTRARLTAWSQSHRSAAHLLTAARRRRDDLVATAGDPEPLLAALRSRFDATDWQATEDSSREAHEALRQADRALDRAAGDPAGDHLVTATAALRRAARALRGVEDGHRIAFQAADNAEAELATAREEFERAIRTVSERPDAFEAGAAQRLRAQAAEIDAASATAPRRPRAAIATVARAREERDRVLGEGVSARLRLEAARTALPGTLACARAALADVDTREAGAEEPASIADRLRRERARRYLAEARATTDAADALAAARAAWDAVR